MIHVEVACAFPNKQWLIKIELNADATIKTAIEKSGILNHIKTLTLNNLEVGVFGRKVGLETCLNDGDRIEIYRPLLIDPKQARRMRSLKKA